MLVSYNDPILRRCCFAIDFDNPQIDPSKLAEDLMTEKNRHRGYGLAAPQIGVPYRAFAFLDEVAFNPWFTKFSKEHVSLVEGCLSFPNLWLQIKRPKYVSVGYFTENGKEISRDLDQLESRIFQHEYNHIHGVTFTYISSDLKLRRAIEQANKHGQNYTFKELRQGVL